MKSLTTLAIGLALGLAACAVPPDSGQAAGPTDGVATPPVDATAPSTSSPTTPEPTSGPSASPAPSSSSAPSPGPSATAEANGSVREAPADQSVVPTPAPSPPSPSPLAPPDGGRAAPSGAQGPPPGLPTLPDHVVERAGGRGSGAQPPELPARPSDLAPGEQADLARAWAGSSPRDWRVLRGFVGSRWDEALSGDLQVLTDTITVRDGVATGLVRNERRTAAGPIVVSAGGAGAEAIVPVARPGEPVPFRLEVGDVDASTLTFTASAARATPRTRDLLLVTWWQRGVTDSRPADTYLWTEPASGPRPIVVFGTATAVVDGMNGIEVAGAWIDDAGHVIGVTEGVVGQPSVSSGGEADFVVATTGPDDLDTAQLMLWGWGA